MASTPAVHWPPRLLAAAVTLSVVHGQTQRLLGLATDRHDQSASLMDTKLLTLSPFLMAHDAGSGYLGEGLVNAWTKTQSGGLRQQLDCGARAFDARPTMHPKYGLIWHHGIVNIHHRFEMSLVDIMHWCEAHPSELVLLMISQCAGTGCLQAVRAVFAKHNVRDLRECDTLGDLTYADATAQAALPMGGSLLAVTGPPAQSGGVACSVGNYDPSQTCAGFVRRGAQDASSVHACGRSILHENSPLTEPLLTSDEIALLQDCARNGSISKVDKSAAYGCWRTDTFQDVPIGRMLTQAIFPPRSALVHSRPHAHALVRARHERAFARARRHVQVKFLFQTAHCERRVIERKIIAMKVPVCLCS
uniref:Phosphatidylinositol-specific phospholipase C X domain-containing protein n=1 Tax=Chrysotila carterae TaxID=13221 RepID=A0A7S4B8E3_CHRCT